MKNRIFVMIPSYRDPVLAETLDTMYELADYPDRVFAAVGAQYDEEIPMPDLSKYPQKNMRLIQVHPENRMAVYRLRHVLNKLYFGEEYYLSIDSHTIFKKGWDSELIDMLEGRPWYRTIISAMQEEPLELYSDHWLKPTMKVEYSEQFGARLVMPGSEPVSWAGEKFVQSTYLQAGMFFTRGDFATEIRWGQYWQHEQEEPFLTFEAFMKGYRLETHVFRHPFEHSPQKYYDAVYNTKPNSFERDFRDTYNLQKDYRPSVCKEIMRAYLYNEGPYRIDNAFHKPETFWHWQNLSDDYFSMTLNDAHTV